MSWIALDTKNLFTSRFNTERDYQSYMMDNIENFCIDVLGDKIKVATKERHIKRVQNFNDRKCRKRVDIFLECERGNYIIELKNQGGTEDVKAIGQLLDYGRELAKYKPKLLLLTTDFSIDTAETINEYNLPITYMYFDGIELFSNKEL